MNKLFTHRTKEGQVMLILNMEDRHLINTARMLVRQAAQLRTTKDLNIDEIDEALLFSGRQNITDPRQIARMIEAKIESALPFLLELHVRGIYDEQLREDLIKALNRKQLTELKAAGDIMLPPLDPIDAKPVTKTHSVKVHGSDNTDFFADDPLGDL
jgi:hypothetical protein